MALKILETSGLFVFFTYFVFSSEGLPFLLFANRKDIRFLDTEVRRKNVSSIIAGHLEDAAALDFYYAGGLIFWADVGLEEIRGMNINDSKSNKSIIATGLISPDGLACDWLGKKLYWTDSETNRIEVSNFDGSHRKVLFWKDLDQPRAIVLVPMDGLMFWTDWGESPKIEKASMDGNHNYRKIIVNDNIFWPNGITADYDLKRIFWADAKLKFISSMDFDGKNRKIVASGNLPHPFALTVYNDMLYWTDWETRAIHSCNRTFGCTKRTTFGGFLSPMGIHIHLQERQPFAHTPCASNNGGCSHLCLVSAYKPYYTCACPTGVRLKEDEKSCADGAEELLLLVRRTDIRRISLDTPDFTDVVLELDGIKHAIAVDYDPVEEYMYWSDDEARAIRRAFLNGTGQENLITTEVHHPDGLSVDWIARNLYWSDTGTDRIEVARLNGSSRKILITENLDEPRAIVLDPSEGYMYWTDWGDSPKIERAALDGSFRSILINTSLGWPNGLSIDYEEKKLYWGDAKTDKIEMANCDGTDRRVLVSDQLPHIFGFTSLGKHIYWTDWQRRSIERVDKITGVMREIIVDQLPDLMGLKAINVKDTHGTNPCAGNNGNCTHLCLNRPKNDYICSCPMGLELSSDNITCVVPEAFLLFSRRDNIRRISLESNRGDIIPVSGVQEANALDYDINDHRIYWTDTTLKTINRAFINGSNMEPVIEFGLSYPEGMALDWVAHNLYWTDMGSNRIEVSRLDGSSRKVLLWRHMDDPRSLALDPSEGYMYWSDWASNSRIERASMDGSHRKILISKLGRANGLAIDYVERRLYWIDINALRIESSDLSGNNRNQIISEDLLGPYSLTQYEDYIYWTDWKTNSIERANKTSGENRTMIQKNLDNVMDILVFHTSRQSGWNQCAMNKGGCSHLCLALPSSIQNKSYTHHCACPTHYSLAPDNKTCKSPMNFMLFSQRNSISRMLLEPIDSPDITLPIHGLKNIRSIGYDPVEHFVYWIDGRTKTIKKGLENGTKVSVVVPNTGETLHPYDFALDIFSHVMYWSCSQNNIINVTGLNGNGIGTVIGEIDDRPRCISIHALKGLLFWTNMVYPPEIIKSNMDGHMRKVLFSTDMDRPTSLTVDTQSDLLFWADVGLKQIESSSITGDNRKVLLSGDLLHPLALSIFDKHLYWIDQDQQIIERINKLTGEERQHIQGRMSFLTDLVAVSSITETVYKSHKCAMKKGGCSHLCIVVNGKKHCACPLDLVLSTDEASCVSPPTCPLNQFRCTSGITCIPDTWRCNGVTECEDMSDEMNCAECKSRQFRCQNGDCIDDKLRCDMVPQCKDYSDELCCQENLFLCSNTYQCIQSFMLCDGKKDCRDGTDEHRSNCEVLLIQSHTDLDQKHLASSHIIGISAAAGTVFFILLITYGCKRKICNDNENLDMSDIMMAANPGIPHITCIGNSYSCAATALYHPNVTVASNNVPQCFNNEKLFDFNHVGGGASSTTSSGTYPHETLNPPPSPVTVHSQHMYGYCCPSHASSSLRSYRHYRSRNRPPPPTPCSTDVCDDSEPYPYRNKYCSPGIELSYDSDPFIPPPPTPRSHCVSDDNYDTLLSCPPSPSTEHSFYNPHPPPPSPMPESDY